MITITYLRSRLDEWKFALEQFTDGYYTFNFGMVSTGFGTFDTLIRKSPYFIDVKLAYEKVTSALKNYQSKIPWVRSKAAKDIIVYMPSLIGVVEMILSEKGL